MITRQQPIHNSIFFSEFLCVADGFDDMNETGICIRPSRNVAFPLLMSSSSLLSMKIYCGNERIVQQTKSIGSCWRRWSLAVLCCNGDRSWRSHRHLSSGYANIQRIGKASMWSYNVCVVCRRRVSFDVSLISMCQFEACVRSLYFWFSSHKYRRTQMRARLMPVAMIII